MNVFSFLVIFTLNLAFIPGQTLQNGFPKANTEAQKVSTIEDLDTNPESQDLYYLSSIPSAPKISAAPNITTLLSTVDMASYFASVSPNGEIAILSEDEDSQCYYIYNISSLIQPTMLSSICLETLSAQLAIISSDSQTGFFTNQEQDQLFVVDLSDPVYPSVVSTFIIPTYTFSMILSPDGQALFVQSRVITIIDISNPESLRNISTYTFASSDDYNYNSNQLYINNNMLFSIAGGYNVYVVDISDLENLTTVAILNISIPLNLVVSSDGLYLYLLSYIDSENYYQIFLQVFDLSNITSITQISSVSIGDLYSSADVTMSISPDNTRIYITGFDAVDVSNITNPILYSVNPLLNSVNFALLPDGKTAIISGREYTEIVQLQFDVPVSLSENIVADIPLVSIPSGDGTNMSMAVSSDSNTLFILFPSNFSIVDVSNTTSPSVLSSFNTSSLGNNCVSVNLSPDDQTAFLICTSEMIIVNISDLASPNLLGTFPVNSVSYQLTTTSDGQTGFLLTSDGMQILNLTNLADLSVLSTYTLAENLIPNIIKMSQDPNIVYLYAFGIEQQPYPLGNDFLEIVDISNLASPVMIYSTLSGSYEDLSDYPLFMSISPGTEITLTIFDASFSAIETETSPPGSLPLPLQITTSEIINLYPMTIFSTSFSPTIYLLTEDGQIVVIDISMPTSPIIVRFFNADSVVSMALSPDASTLYLGQSNGSLDIMDLTPQYSLYLTTKNFMLGEVVSNDLVPLILSSTNEFVTLDQDFTFTQLSLYTVSIGTSGAPSSSVAYLPLPSWIIFNQNQLTITFAPDDATQIGTYQLYGVASTIISRDAFVGIGNITNSTESLDLFALLVSLEYINNQGFLTSGFNPNNFFLTSEYSQNQVNAFLNVLMGAYIEVTITFSVASSLSLQQVVTTWVNSSIESTITKAMTLNTLNPNLVNIEITLSSNLTQFVNAASIVLAIISNNQMTISLNGALVDINTAISQIIVNLPDNMTTCNGTITISDNLNPTLYQDISNICDYFTKNGEPMLNPNFSIQAVISNTPILTGEQFILDLTNMFVDPNGQVLQYTLAMQDSSDLVPEWLSFRGESIMGTPPSPSQISNMDVNLIITASNQFKSTSQAFTIHIGYSLSYILQLIGTYGGALLTIIGLYVYLHTIYNVLCKRRYRYPKDFVIRAGDKNSVQQISAISFISGEIKASKLILNYIKKDVAKEINSSSVNMNDLVKYFMDPTSRQLREDQLIQMIKYGMSKISNNSKEEVKGHLRITVIKQLIMNELVNTQLNSPLEERTKHLFNQIKKTWVDLIDTSRDHGFSLNKDKLAIKLRNMKVNSYKPSKDAEAPLSDTPPDSSSLLSPETTNPKKVVDLLVSGSLDSSLPGGDGKKSIQKNLIDPIEIETLRKTGINFYLLEKAITALAFKHHNLDVTPIRVEVLPFEKYVWSSSASAVLAFFKLDLKSIKFVKGCEIGYGISYKINKGILRFYGTPQEDIKDKTLVVQIVNRYGWILSELTLKCVGKISEEEKTLVEEQVVL